MRKLCKINEGKMLLGVCTGFAAFFNTDVTFIRFLMIMLGLMGPGIIAYLVALIIMPDQNKVK